MRYYQLKVAMDREKSRKMRFFHVQEKVREFLNPCSKFQNSSMNHPVLFTHGQDNIPAK